MPEERKVRVKSRETEHKEAFGAVVKARKKLSDARLAREAADRKHKARVYERERELVAAEKHLASFNPEPSTGDAVTVETGTLVADEPHQPK